MWGKGVEIFLGCEICEIVVLKFCMFFGHYIVPYNCAKSVRKTEIWYVSYSVWIIMYHNFPTSVFGYSMDNAMEHFFFGGVGEGHFGTYSSR